MQLTPRELRKDLGLTLEEVHLATGISTSHLSRLERGLTPCSDTVKCKLASVYGATPWEIAWPDLREKFRISRLGGGSRVSGIGF